MNSYKISLPNDFQSADDCAAMDEAGESYEEIAIAAKGAGMKYVRDTDYGAVWSGSESQFLQCVENLPSWAKRYATKEMA